LARSTTVKGEETANKKTSRKRAIIIAVIDQKLLKIIKNHTTTTTTKSYAREGHHLGAISLKFSSRTCSCLAR